TNTIPATESHLINTRSRLQLNVSLFSAEDNDQQIRLEEATRELSQRRTEVNQLFDQLSRVEKSRTAVIDKALASRSKFSEEMQKLLASTAFQFVHDRFERSDAKQFNEFCQILLNAHRNPSLINFDGQLDLRAVLATPFGRQLIEHDEILEAPLILFLCGFFTYPHFYRGRRLHVISDWKHFQNQLDIRTINPLDLIIYCPSKQSFNCCLLSIKNESRSISIHMFSLQQNIDTYELNVILNDNLPEGIKINI
ncbi:unnamed protein product, partial [Rotaria magnacalcarata]